MQQPRLDDSLPQACQCPSRGLFPASHHHVSHASCLLRPCPSCPPSAAPFPLPFPYIVAHGSCISERIRAEPFLNHDGRTSSCSAHASVYLLLLRRLCPFRSSVLWRSRLSRLVTFLLRLLALLLFLCALRTTVTGCLPKKQIVTHGGQLDICWLDCRRHRTPVQEHCTAEARCPHYRTART